MQNQNQCVQVHTTIIYSPLKMANAVIAKTTDNCQHSKLLILESQSCTGSQLFLLKLSESIFLRFLSVPRFSYLCLSIEMFYLHLTRPQKNSELEKNVGIRSLTSGDENCT
jgi:hypothetical protein